MSGKTYFYEQQWRQRRAELAAKEAAYFCAELLNGLIEPSGPPKGDAKCDVCDGNIIGGICDTCDSVFIDGKRVSERNS